MPRYQHRLDPDRLARAYLAQRRNHKDGPTIRFHHGEFWVWEGQQYRSVLIDEHNAELRAFLQETVSSQQIRTSQQGPLAKVTVGLVNEVKAALASLVLVPNTKAMPVWLGQALADVRDYIAFTNGLVSLDELLEEGRANLRPLTPNWFSATVLPYDYEPTATRPKFVWFLDETFEGDPSRIALMQEWFGYSLTPDTSMHKFMIWLGNGANGKSVLLDVLNAVVGDDNASHVPMEMFSERFQLVPIINKLVNTAGEIGRTSAKNEAKLKEVASGDKITLDRKNIQPITVKPTAKLVFAGNELPHFSDRSEGLWRRIIVVPFRRSVPEREQDHHLADKLKAELPGIFNWAVAGLARLREQDRFTGSRVCNEATLEFQRDTNPARTFLKEEVRQEPTGWIQSIVLYRAYARWAKARGYQVLPDAEFGKEVATVFPWSVRKKATIKERRIYVRSGIRLDDPEAVPDWLHGDCSSVIELGDTVLDGAAQEPTTPPEDGEQ